MSYYTQAIYRRLLAIVLGPEYSTQEDKNRFLRKVMTAIPPSLPHQDGLRERIHRLRPSQTPRVHELRQNKLIKSTTWRLENWSLFQQTARTNNDVEGWHLRINNRVARVGPSLRSARWPFLGTNGKPTGRHMKSSSVSGRNMRMVKSQPVVSCGTRHTLWVSHQHMCLCF